MIRVVTLDSYDEKQLGKFTQLLYAAFGVGAEAVEQREISPEFGKADEPLDAEAFLANPPKVTSFQDDKVLFLTSRKLKDRQLPSGKAPTYGFAADSMDKAIISTHGVKDFEAGMKVISRHSMHMLGRLWELHHCLDPRCSMYLPWTPSYAQGDAIFCNFCRDKSEQKIRLAKS